MEPSLQERLIAGRYRLVRPLSAGGMGQVYKAVDTQLFDRPVAVKILHQHLGGDEGTLESLQRRFEVEAQISILLGEHPHIITVLDYGIEGHSPYLVMELLSGSSLSDLLIKEGAMAPERVVTLGRQMCGAFHHAHQFQVELGNRLVTGVIHRDIKPSNLFILKDKTQQESVKVLDFGIAKVISDVSMALGTQTGSFLGTLRYASPEQLDGEALTIRSDIYSFGIVLYQMLTGEMPIRPATDTFPGWYRAHHEQQPRPPHQITSLFPIPVSLAEVVMSCLEKDPARRPQDMHVLERALADTLQTTGGSLSGSAIPVSASSSVPNSPTEQPRSVYTQRLLAPLTTQYPGSRYPTWLPWAGVGAIGGLILAVGVSGIQRVMTPSPPWPEPVASPADLSAVTPTPVAPETSAPLPTSSPTPTSPPTATPAPTLGAIEDPNTSDLSCQLEYSIRSQWDQGFVMDLWIRPLAAPVSNWQLNLRFPTEQVRIVDLWKGTYAQQGATLQINAFEYNQAIPEGGRTDLGFQAQHPGGVVLPEQITLNGVPCQLINRSAAASTSNPTAASPTPVQPIRIQVDRDGVQLEGIDPRVRRSLEELREPTGREPGEILRRLGE